MCTKPSKLKSFVGAISNMNTIPYNNNLPDTLNTTSISSVFFQRDFL